MKGSELIRRLRQLAKEKGLRFEYEPRHGKGSHGQLLLGDRLTTIKDPKKRSAPGCFTSMLKQLSVNKDDLS